ncbi:hypothetical protein SERLA73DRAFT_95826 [Serpula lacrymans var. lacrymans S7.3]|uniref:Impact N-terminal domain-containing protein n=2 Tax=Serpula lacrymans var. lacrymans TaxID=341189 RepID=F8Q981_SERL3|nr:uncharacterized protein SERLADRAFT_477053 [Serpula lacrymans var. lacrymans S7.9]EGN95136.1 hypothetical protein SERLA73DRAFT_95826 [Serpula lacrymans var. lacrymans S7.3]EGO20646.1 hypothetical protein SERLADRAFT_477053 [Serpula lacrymans var. lacrymans S7.9]
MHSLCRPVTCSLYEFKHPHQIYRLYSMGSQSNPRRKSTKETPEVTLSSTSTGHPQDDSWPYTVYSSAPIIDRKSKFIAHASSLPNISLLPSFLRHLSKSPQLKRSTHFMYAYRTAGANVSGHNDGGESGSGERLSRLLELTQCKDVIVVVSRWYGGVQLGSDRWKRISDVAKEALSRGTFSVRREAREGSTVKSRK